ncbi:MAG: Signal transduction histidine kinase CheA [uncultured Pyrinomonadaceae bacterium]|uniref:histidine kinase n=1 Tax=uncultured Pyrinomonadaceae bacterium TaxID=2283094 RepID=A0A6J4NS30_9BACT|nr:MAG: Signal transduction histidine kinase CheA [uncultured Pyrinomonadaceae bacterium]
MNSELLQEFLVQAEKHLPKIRSEILVCAQTGDMCGEINASLCQTSLIKNAALVAGLDEISKIAGELEENLKRYARLEAPLTGEQSRGLLDKLTELEVGLAPLRLDAEDFSIYLDDFIDQSFENLGLTEPGATDAGKQAGDWEEEFEIDEEMLEIFGEEAEELIQNIRSNLVRLEKNPNDCEALLEVRRSAHTLKGSAGIVGLKVLSGVAHRVEDSLDYLAENNIVGNAKIFELLSTATDCFEALARNEKPASSTLEVEQVYKDFDALMLSLKFEDAAQTALASADESNFAVSDVLDDMLPVGDSSAFEILSSETGKRQQTSDRREIAEQRQANPPPEASVHKSVVRVSLEKLDDLVKIMNGLVVSRSVFEQRLAELEQQIGELHNSTRRLSYSTNKLETDFETDMLETESQMPTGFGFRASGFEFQSSNPKFQTPNPKSFDALELDRYTEFHQTMRDLIETTGDTSAINAELDALRGNLETLFENQRHLIEQMHDKLLHLRMVSFGSLGMRLQRTVRVTADEEEKSAELAIEGEALEVDTQILDSLIEPLMHLLRNAVAHGIEAPDVRRLLGKPETGRIRVRVRDEGAHFVLSVSDDGRGISAVALKAKAVQCGIISEREADAMSEQKAFALIFHAGLTTAAEVSQVSGRGVGMNIVKTAVERRQGAISIDSETHKGATFTLRLPVALAVTRALLVKAGGQTFAFPLKFVTRISNRSAVGGQQSETDNQIAANAEQSGKARQPKIKEPEPSIFHLNNLLGLPFAAPSTATANDAETPVLLLKTTDAPCSLIVDEIVKPEEIVIKPLDAALRNLKGFLGACILGDGSVVPVIDLLYLLERQIQSPKSDDFGFRTTTDCGFQDEGQNSKTEDRRPINVLIVDDSPSVRHLTSQTIANAGWTARVAKDGLEALNISQNLRDLPDVILTDVEMPRMNGYELLASLKKQENTQKIPVVMITSRANEKHRRKAFDLGAAEYLTKPFDEAKLIELIKNLIA